MQRRRRSIGQAKKGNNALAWILVTVLLIGAAYIGAASKLGVWLAQYVVQPVFVSLGIFEKQPTPTGTAGPTGTVSVTAKGFTVYTLQSGVFANADNANKAAKDQEAKGAAGVVYQSAADSTRVLVSVYATEQEAQTVRTRMKDTLETRLYRLECAQGVVAVNTKAQADALGNVLTQFDGLRTALLKASLDASDDKKTATLNEALTKLNSFKQMLSASMDAGQSAFVDALDQTCAEVKEQLNAAIAASGAKRLHHAQAAGLTLCIGYQKALHP